jgi:cholesterol transport system auxiliary component
MRLALSTHRVAQLAIASAVLLSACTGSLLDTELPVPTIFVLKSAPPGATGTPTPGADLAISQAETTPGLNTERIAVLHEGRRLDYVLNAQWGAALPQVVQAVVVGSLQNQKWFRNVASEQTRVNTNYWLDLEVRDFQAEYESEGTVPTVRVTLVGSLIRIKDRKLLGVFPATATVKPAENRLGATIQAFESAAQQAALSLGTQAGEAIRSAGE